MAIGVLLELGLANTIPEAEKAVQNVRPEVNVHEEFKKDLEKLYSKISY
ncbi:hypothetical protein ACM26V_19295 [Salipaludibacillus sp. HK11]